MGNPVATHFIKRFFPANTDELLDSAFFAGNHDERLLTVAGIETRIASDPHMNAERQLFEQVLSTYLPAYANLFENGDVASPLIIALPGSFWGGGVMGRTISLTHGGELHPAVEPMVKYIVGHEVFHLWNVQWRYHDRKGAEVEWIKEGSAEYFTWLTALRAGDIPPDVFFAQISDRWDIYKEAISTQSIASAGKSKLENQQSYDLVYSGGMMLALALDLIIREDTGNEKSLDDVMAYLQEYNSGADGIPLTVRTLQAAIKQSTGVKTANFFRDYLYHASPLPLAAYLRSVGLCFSEIASGEQKTASIETCPDESIMESSARAVWLVEPGE